MIHGPCGALNPQCPCVKDGLCTTRYPKAFRTQTNANLNGYPEYRRRETCPLHAVKNGVLDAHNVVPCSGYLLEQLDCHVNVE
eukprot:2434828-Pyramimonas_sp.AAC.1